MSDPFIGEIRLFAFARVPDGWLPCNGQPLPISQFTTLFAVIGTTYGGDGNQSFNAPDLRGRVPIGQGQGQSLPNFALGQIGGEDNHTLVNGELPSHSHALVSSTATANTATPATNVHLATASTSFLYAPAANAAPYDTMAACILPAGNSVGHNNIMPTVVANYCICFNGIFPSQG
jgi:microcystin-dependent protein